MNVMTKRGTQDNNVTYEHVCDAPADLVNIPQDQISLGSTAIVLKGRNDSLEIYMATSNKQWVPVTMNGSDSSGVTLPSVDGSYILKQANGTTAYQDMSELKLATIEDVRMRGRFRLLRTFSGDGTTSLNFTTDSNGKPFELSAVGIYLSFRNTVAIDKKLSLWVDNLCSYPITDDVVTTSENVVMNNITLIVNLENPLLTIERNMRPINQIVRMDAYDYKKYIGFVDVPQRMEKLTTIQIRDYNTNPYGSEGQLTTLPTGCNLELWGVDYVEPEQ